MPFDLNALLLDAKIAPESVLVLRHRPHERALNKVLPWLAAERPELYNAFQQTHAEQLEAAMERLEGVGYVASFLGRKPAQALFVGLYSIGRSKRLTFKQFWQLPEHRELRSLGMEGLRAESGRSTILRFDLKLLPFYSSWKGKMSVTWPPPERAWWRRAHKNSMPIVSILEESALTSTMPEWYDISLTWDELLHVPSRWKTSLAEWRGIYHILDQSDGRRYIGSAAGTDNLFGRWINYAKTGHGGNTLLRQRDPRNFTFTILQRLSPDLPPADVSSIEASWKRRLQTRAPLGLNDN